MTNEEIQREAAEDAAQDAARDAAAEENTFTRYRKQVTDLTIDTIAGYMKGLVDVIDFQDEGDVLYTYNDIIYQSRYLAEERFYADGDTMTEKEKFVFFLATIPEYAAKEREEMYINVGWGSEFHYNQRYLFDLCSQAAQIDAGEDFSPIRMCPDCADTFDPETGQKHSHLRVVEGGKK